MKVHLYRQEEYKLEEIMEKVACMLTDIDEKLASPKRILIKPNLLMKASPDRHITTHPTLVEALTRVLQKKGHEIIVADSPGGPMKEILLKNVYTGTGMKAVADKTGLVLNLDGDSSEIYSENAYRLKRFPVLKVVQQADLIINLPKAKTHGMMTYTGAVKNLYGVIPGLSKASHHFKLQKTIHFAHHLVDIAEWVQADYHILDAVVSMEGNGPSSGTLRPTGILAGSADPFLLDQSFCEIFFPNTIIPTLQVSAERGLLKAKRKYPGLRPEDFKEVPFVLPESQDVTFLPTWLPQALRQFFTSLFKARPHFIHARCISCGRCRDICPAKVIRMPEGRPHVDLKGCIRCFCCHEICPVKAIEIRRHGWKIRS